ncbi:sulfatase-like hydrolase/transferase [Luteolibacter sp. Populi]|uniref:sulfatase-like hydrolase/transferase n=1 Tax=Luteolibacter sp. Populi TaxID=3230487 RepID=UPI003465274D
MKSALFLIGVLCGVPLAGAAEKQPNIIYILCDDMGYGDMGVFFQNRLKKSSPGAPSFSTPQLDRLAREGIAMEGMYCPAPVCAPSRASLLTGVHQGHASVRDNQFDKALEDNHTLATVLKEAGYATAVIGKWGLQGNAGGGRKNKAARDEALPEAWPAYPTKRGFDYFFGYVRHGDGHEHYPKEGIYKGAKQVWENEREVSRDLDRCYTTDLFTARAKKWIEEEKKATPHKPFFLYLAYDTPHAVDEYPACAYPDGAGLRGGLQWTGEPGAMINTAAGTPDSWCHPDYAGQAWPDVSKRYATSVRRIDDCVGDLIGLLKDLKIDDDTLVIFTTDNGPSQESYLKGQELDPGFFQSFGPFDGIKRDCWEGGVRVGAIVRAPGLIPAGRTSNAPAQFHDWMPTFAELAGVPVPARADGVSLVPLLTGKGVQKPSQVYIEYAVGGKTPNIKRFEPEHRGRSRGQMQMIRIGEYTGVRYDIKDAGAAFEIYDVVRDPRQSTNLADKKPELQKQMRDQVLRMRRPNPSAARPYDDVPVPALGNVKTGPGLVRSSYSGSFPWLARVDGLKPTDSGIFADLSACPVETAAETLYAGYLIAPADGAYTLSIGHGAQALLRVHDATVIDQGFRKQATNESAEIRLTAGVHRFRLYTAKSGEGSVPVLSWKVPGGEALVPVPAAAFGHEL